MPYPQNVETAKAVENIIREQGAVPATIALLDGRVHIGKESNTIV
jgi:pseudouridine-5'-phosphate glycosidase